MVLQAPGCGSSHMSHFQQAPLAGDGRTHSPLQFQPWRKPRSMHQGTSSRSLRKPLARTGSTGRGCVCGSGRGVAGGGEAEARRLRYSVAVSTRQGGVAEMNHRLPAIQGCLLAVKGSLMSA